MKRGDLVEGREYALRRSRYFPPRRVRLIALDGEATVTRTDYAGRPHERTARGIIVENLDGEHAGKRQALDSARPLVGEWAAVDREGRATALREDALARSRAIRYRAERGIAEAAESAEVGRPASVESTVALIEYVLDASQERRGQLRGLVAAVQAIAAARDYVIREVEERRDADLAEIEAEVES